MGQMTEKTLRDMGSTYRMVGALFGNDEYLHMLTLPDCDLAEVHVLWDALTDEEWQAILKNVDTQPVEAWVKKGGADPAKAIIRKCERQINQNIAWRVYRRDVFTCRYCGADDKPMTVDHLVLWEDGGPTTEANMVTACSSCNKKRGNMAYEDWLVSDYYVKISKDLSAEQQEANTQLVGTLHLIEKHPIKKKR